MLHALTSARLEFIVDDTSGSLEVMHLGSPVGHVDPTSFSAPTPEGGVDHLAPIAVLAEAAAGWMGKPGLRLHRDGTGAAKGHGQRRCLQLGPVERPPA